MERRERTARYVAIGFRYHLRAYLMVNALLIAIWLLTTGPGSHPWPVWPIGGWGIGLYFHWVPYREHTKRTRELRAQFEDGAGRQA
ncbi:MAG: 2TM domain-containing protein [Actinobacteria bacterium]|nr:2TM domain-containing protein [Actinomycetota bacterium]